MTFVVLRFRDAPPGLPTPWSLIRSSFPYPPPIQRRWAHTQGRGGAQTVWSCRRSLGRRRVLLAVVRYTDIVPVLILAPRRCRVPSSSFTTSAPCSPCCCSLCGSRGALVIARFHRREHFVVVVMEMLAMGCEVFSEDQGEKDGKPRTAWPWSVYLVVIAFELSIGQVVGVV